eukprot:XP_001689552.1 predicted protein [Chlamydomonas reinhardtii]
MQDGASRRLRHQPSPATHSRSDLWTPPRPPSHTPPQRPPSQSVAPTLSARSHRACGVSSSRHALRRHHPAPPGRARAQQPRPASPPSSLPARPGL